MADSTASNAASRVYDLVVIGAGPVGENVADRAVQAGLTAVIVESELVGGECSYWACMPTKALLRTGAAWRAADALGVAGTIDANAVLKRRDSFASDWHDDGQVGWLESASIHLIRGHGRLDGEKRVVVSKTDGTQEQVEARHAVAICTGSAANLPDVEGLAAARPWSSREAASAHHVPKRLLVIGGGVVAAEMATAYASLGSAVTLRSRSALLGGREAFAGELVAQGLRDLGVDVGVGASPVSVSRETEQPNDLRPAGPVTVTFDDGTSVVADELLVATGRSPRTTDLGLETVHLSAGDWLPVDDTLLVEGVSGQWLYAVGDVNHRALLTHQGKYQARAAGDVVAARALGRPVDDAPWGAHVATADHAAVPQVVFTSPEVASVGLTAEEAEHAASDAQHIRALDYELGHVAGASLQADGYAGHARFVVDVQRGVIVGATFVGPEVAELLHAATVAVVGEVPIKRLWHAVPSYPTVSEIWLRLLEELGRDSA
ncbi:dihydrolipoyl dehydrogenase family protein [Lysinibacter cavernae]|uniref:Dihydrolipoamide dehydrogenase n=1 Tax=Lysinibacter cavernae TaxID=1640652 RepID=A0A7X5R459_9MICO|nr:NAD(P)/FAD-dependent oxidoreductase [Lysinibacter cavernae]NIH54995.1 dihydrolipoamide dehydrogenase [Lysinibacter cavernae]